MTHAEIEQAIKDIAQAAPCQEHSIIHDMTYELTQDLTEYMNIVNNVDILLDDMQGVKPSDESLFYRGLDGRVLGLEKGMSNA